MINPHNIDIVIGCGYTCTARFSSIVAQVDGAAKVSPIIVAGPEEYVPVSRHKIMPYYVDMITGYC